MKLFCLIVLLMMPAPAMAVDFILEAYIPADASLLEHRGTLDLAGDGLGGPQFVIPATDPLGDYTLTHVVPFIVSPGLPHGTYPINVTLVSVDQAGNVSEEATASMLYTVGEAPDTMPPSTPSNVTVR